MSIASATQVVSGQVVTAMGQAGGELAAYVKTQIIAKGANQLSGNICDRNILFISQLLARVSKQINFIDDRLSETHGT